jgi:predicted GTPase
MATRKVIIAGAGGRDFHNFNCVYRDDPAEKVVAFTATQIPGIDQRRYPPELAGPYYPEGIDIVPEEQLEALIDEHDIDEVVLSYSDLPFEYVMTFASRVIAAGADFKLIGARKTLIKSSVPVISVCAVRTGCGKSQTTRKIAGLLSEAGKRVVAIRHPMPYGNLVKQRVQRFADLSDLDKHECTIEEREEYEPLINAGVIVMAGVDYAAILAEAEKEADIVLWDGGNNDLPFYKPDYEIVVADPLRLGHEQTYYPGASNVLRADCVVINKAETAGAVDVATLRDTIRRMNPDAVIIEAASPLMVEDGDQIRGQRVLCVEDGPTLTHGDMKYGAAYLAARRYGAAEIVDPRPFAVGDLKGVFEKYSHLDSVLPAVGYGDDQVKDLAATIRAVDCDVVLIGTPIDLRRIIDIGKPALRVLYNLQEIGDPTLESVLKERGFFGG